MSVRSLDNAPRRWYGQLAEEATSVTLPGSTEIPLVRSPHHPSWHWDAQTADAAALVNSAASHVSHYDPLRCIRERNASRQPGSPSSDSGC